MISNAFKKQMIDNTYKTQLLPVIKDKVDETIISVIKNKKNMLLFKKYQSLWTRYKYKKNINIEYDIYSFLYYLTYPIFSIYNYSENNKKYDIQEIILNDMKDISNKKQDIEESSYYAEYLEDVHDQ